MDFSKIKRLFSLCMLIGIAGKAFGYIPPQKENVHIELHYDIPATTNVMGASEKKGILPYTYFMLSDIYTDETKKVSSDTYDEGVTALDFELNHPLYDYIMSSGNVKIPFYVEPGDSLIINVTKLGKVLSYKNKKGGEVKYEKMLLHDFSNNIFYTEKLFKEDKQDVRFPEFVSRVMIRMNAVIDTVNMVAIKYAFSPEELNMAVNNVKIQYGRWLLQYAPYESLTANGNSLSKEEQEAYLAEITDAANYAFLKKLPFNDSTCVASRFFPRFIECYQNCYYLNSDQRRYYSPLHSSKERMDSAYIAKDLAVTGQVRLSVFMGMAMARRNYEAPNIDDNGTVELKEVKVLGQRKEYAKAVTTEEMVRWRQEQKVAGGVFSPSYWLGGRKQEKKKERVRKLVDQIAAEDDAREAEHDAIMKAYNEEMERQKAKKNGKKE